MIVKLGLTSLLFISTIASAGPITATPLTPNLTKPKLQDFSNRSPIAASTKLYVGCVKSTMLSVKEIEPTRVGINSFVADLDVRCLTWTLVWYPALMDGADFSAQAEVLEQFNQVRLRTLQTLTSELRKQAMIR